MTADQEIEKSLVTLAMAEQAPAPRALGSAPCLLKVRGLKKSFGGQVVLAGLNFDLHRGEVVLLRGENGSGKTTLLNILTGNIEPDAGGIQYLADGTPRNYPFPRHWWEGLAPFDHFTPEYVAREGVGRTWQDVRLFGSQSLRDNIAVAEPGQPGENPLLALFTPGRCARREAEIECETHVALARLGLAEREDSSADKISLGQSKRVAIARAIAAGAQILFLDEPLAGLDSQGISDILALLNSLVRERDLTLVIVEHFFNQPHLDQLVTTDWLLAQGRLTTSEVRYETPGPPRMAVLLRPSWLELIAGAETQIVDEPLPRGALLTRIRRGDRLHDCRKPILEIEGLVVKRGARTVIGLDDQGQPGGFHLVLHAGEIAIIQAPNGWGKSTLFAAITGLIQDYAGSIRLSGAPVDGQPVWERVKAGIAALPSDRHTFPALRETEALKLANKPSSRSSSAPANRLCGSLSGGQKQRLALETMPRGKLSIYDEPLSALDQAGPLLTKLNHDIAEECSALVLVPSLAAC